MLLVIFCVPCLACFTLNAWPITVVPEYHWQPGVMEGYNRTGKPEALQSKTKPSHLPQDDISPAAGLQPPHAIRTFPSLLGERAAVVKGGHKDSQSRLAEGKKRLGAWGDTRMVVVQQGAKLFLP